MAIKFNPLTGNFDFTGSGGGGGGASYIDGEVQNFSALPQTIGSPAVDSAYLVREAEGAWLLSRKPAGIYIRTDDTGVRADDWTYAGEFPDVFNDANLVVYSNADSTKNVKFDVSAVTTGTTRTITVPDSNVTLPNQGTSTTDSPEFAGLSVGSAGGDGVQLLATNDDGVISSIAPLSSEQKSEARTSLGLGTVATADIDAIPETLRIVGGSDATKKVAFEVDGLTTSTTRTLTVPNASGTLALLETLPAGGTKTYAFFAATGSNQPPATNFAVLDTRNSISVLEFRDTTADDAAIFVGVMPEAADLSSGLKVRIHWMSDTETSGNVRWQAHFQRCDTGTDLDSDSFDANASNEATGTASATLGAPTITEITCGSGAIDGIVAGDAYRLRITREQSDSTNDTMICVAQVFAVEIRSAA